MDAVNFLEECVREVEHDIYNPDCDYESFVSAVETLAKAVEMWAAEYPRKTRQDVFLEQWPDAKLDDDGVLNISPCSLSKKYENCDDPAKSCRDCRREFWMEEVE